MIPEKRKTKRKPFRRTAQILVMPNNPHACALSDMSDSGARIEVEDSGKLPDHFVLLLSAQGKVQRVCRVVWRKPTQVGVEFERAVSAILESAPLLASKVAPADAPEFGEPI